MFDILDKYFDCVYLIVGIWMIKFTTHLQQIKDSRRDNYVSQIKEPNHFYFFVLVDFSGFIESLLNFFASILTLIRN